MHAKPGGNWGLMALMNGAVAVWLIYTIVTATEAPSRALMVLQYALLAGCLIGLGGAVYKAMHGR